MNWLAKHRRQRLFRLDISYRLDSWTDIHTTTDCSTSTTVMVSSHTAVMEMHVVVYSTVKLSAWRRDYFASWRGAKYCDEYVCLSVCMFVCLLSYLGNGLAELHQFLCTSPVAVGRSSADGVVTSYVLPVLWMTSRFHTIGSIAQHVFLSYESITAETVALIPTEVRSMIKISKYTYMSCVEHEGNARGAKSAMCDCHDCWQDRGRLLLPVRGEQFAAAWQVPAASFTLSTRRR